MHKENVHTLNSNDLKIVCNSYAVGLSIAQRMRWKNKEEYSLSELEGEYKGACVSEGVEE